MISHNAFTILLYSTRHHKVTIYLFGLDLLEKSMPNLSCPLTFSRLFPR